MKIPSGDHPSGQQQDDHLSVSSDDAAHFSDMDSDAHNRGRSQRIYIQPPVTINLYGAGVLSTGGSDTGHTAAATTTSSTGTSGRSDAIISRLESQIAALSGKVDQLASQMDSAQPQPRLQVDGGSWSTNSMRARGHPSGPTQRRVAFSKRFESAPEVMVSISNADVDCGKNFRVHVYATNIDSEGFTAHVKSWDDTILYDCGVSWIAIGNEKE